MSKFVNVPYGDYTLTVQDGGTIRLDTGNAVGNVVITGDLYVQGETTEVNTTTMTVEDNTIVLNSGETGNGISLNQSGIEIERGNYLNELFVYDETINYFNPDTQSIDSNRGSWHFKNSDGDIGAIRTHAITTAGGNLALINSGTGVITVTGTNFYEYGVFNYTAPNTINVSNPFGDDGARTTPRKPDEDNIPNGRAVVDYITSYFASVFQDRIEEGDTYVETIDTLGNPGVVQVGVDGNIIANFYTNRVELDNLRISNTTISTTSSNEDLILEAPGTGAIRINDVLQIHATPHIDDGLLDPSAPTEGIKIYSKAQAEGGTGLYFVNNTTNNEIISNNRALVYSMLF